MLFNERKATEVAAFFIVRNGDQLNLLKLMKLMYLAERESLTEYGEPIIGDLLYSLEHGPILSHTYNLANGVRESRPDGWESMISDRENHMVGLKVEIQDAERQLDHLSDADIAVLETVWKKYGGYSPFELRDLTHQLCGEWEDPEQSSIPIPYSRLLRAVGFEHNTARELERRILSQRNVERIFNNTEH